MTEVSRRSSADGDKLPAAARTETKDLPMRQPFAKVAFIYVLLGLGLYGLAGFLRETALAQILVDASRRLVPAVDIASHIAQATTHDVFRVELTTGYATVGAALLYGYFIYRSLRPDALSSSRRVLASRGAHDPSKRLSILLRALMGDLLPFLFVVSLNMERLSIERWQRIFLGNSLGATGFLLIALACVCFKCRHSLAYQYLLQEKPDPARATTEDNVAPMPSQQQHPSTANAVTGNPSHDSVSDDTESYEVLKGKLKTKIITHLCMLTAATWFLWPHGELDCYPQEHRLTGVPYIEKGVDKYKTRYLKINGVALYCGNRNIGFSRCASNKRSLIPFLKSEPVTAVYKTCRLGPVNGDLVVEINKDGKPLAGFSREELIKNWNDAYRFDQKFIVLPMFLIIFLFMSGDVYNSWRRLRKLAKAEGI